MKPLFNGSNKEHWKEVSNMWWKLCKNTDSCGKKTFYDDFEELIEFIKINTNKLSNDRLNWLNGLKQLGPKWAGCFTWSFLTYGLHSTQRAEAINSSIDTFCNKFSTILRIALDLEQMAEVHSYKSEIVTIKSQLNMIIGNGDISSMTAKINETISSFSKHLNSAQSNQVCHYLCKPEFKSKKETADSTYKVKRYSTDITNEVSYDTKNEQSVLERQSDHGIGKTSYTEHTVSLKHCTC